MLDDAPRSPVKRYTSENVMAVADSRCVTAFRREIV